MSVEKPDFEKENLQVFKAESSEEAEQMKKEGKDPIIIRISPEEVAVLTKRQEILNRIKEGNNWNTGQDEQDKYGYLEYIYTRLNEQELKEHLNDPSRFRGSD